MSLSHCRALSTEHNLTHYARCYIHREWAVSQPAKCIGAVTIRNFHNEEASPHCATLIVSFVVDSHKRWHHVIWTRDTCNVLNWAPTARVRLSSHALMLQSSCARTLHDGRCTFFNCCVSRLFSATLIQITFSFLSLWNPSEPVNAETRWVDTGQWTVDTP